MAKLLTKNCRRVILVMPDSEMKYILCYDGMVYIGDKPNDTEDSDVAEETEKAVDETDATS